MGLVREAIWLDWMLKYSEMFDILVGIVLVCQLVLYPLTDFFEVIFSRDDLDQDAIFG